MRKGKRVKRWTGRVFVDTVVPSEGAIQMVNVDTNVWPVRVPRWMLGKFCRVTITTPSRRRQRGGAAKP
jgi:hypothetical protein